jgi:hypothetical protein
MDNFFDKAKTISRAVGYLRILEKVILHKIFVKEFSGFENGLKVFRQHQDEYRKTLQKRKNSTISTFFEFDKRIMKIPTFGYWGIVYIMFFSLSLLCVWLSYIFCTNDTFPIIQYAYLLFLLVGYINWRTLFRITIGTWSYDANEEI